ncbi:SDR family oxidoreductase [Chitinophaga ginsengisoli]|uniref:NAD(P)-dependent dehydrogenase (Short-subunit alcohol dehydrogenase family) n=1 Tax=Chitinophaga ginsengisoli TaxID=363837 RepID=A0A2P8GN46_9BACT|nr:SDR family oxidoreductase [Chitinophaga ginsengisoli]PSL35378.1 NAD(P)-dependent dehydrogenase (short-subunit alcohol dehydrogenase family) [Chitinophaga ginsengisoli]
MKKLQNKTALVTGGNSGIGFATAKEFIQQGAKVIITGRNATALEEAKQSLGENAFTLLSDASNMEDVFQLQQQVKAIFPSLDILFINAGVAKLAPFETMTEAQYDETFNINVKSAYFTIQQLLPLFNDGGSIVLNTSINSHIGMANTTLYAASKGALITMARTLSTELLSRRIRVNAISPGPVKTPLYDKFGFDKEQAEAVQASIVGQVPMGRFGTPEEIARIVTFFASEDSSFVIGAELIADGGMITL